MAVVEVAVALRPRLTLGLTVSTERGTVNYQDADAAFDLSIAPFIRGPKGDPGPSGVEPDLPDLALIFENHLI